MIIRKECAVLTERGGRKVNEDSVLARSFPNGQVVVLGDGLGSNGGGSLASFTAVTEVVSCFEGGGCSDAAGIAETFSRANEAVQNCQTEDCRMMTTLVALFFQGESAVWAHAGDSRLYHFREARLAERTIDHSVSQMAVALGEITEDQIRFHPDRSRILRALGSDSFEPDIAEPVSLASGYHAFLLCSDGFWEYVLETEMEQTLSEAANPDQWLTQMEDILKNRAPADQDNYTAAAVFTVAES
ncbi:MAG: protein phosphatase 2C domain-containing protein [Lachnospiraceae bacterium]|nr:protein phosphatase 2C domain-containing protein [Lachnospiraceae bacterium]